MLVISDIALGGESYPITIDFASLGLSATETVSVRDIWAHADLEGTFQGNFTTPAVAPHDSVFYVLSVN